MNELRESGASKRRPRWKAGLFSAVLMLLFAVIVEAVSYGLLWRMDGQRPRLGETARDADGSVVEQTKDAPVTAGAWSDQVLHPFLGYVQKEDGSISPHLRVNEEGFHTFLEEAPPRAQRFDVAVMGGSVALLFSADARQVLAEELARLPAAAGKRVWITPYALGGYKQPQMLMTLTYLLSAGEAPDLVLLIDGFNDVVLPVAENRMASVHPYWPRGWPARVANVTDPAQQKKLAKLAGLEDALEETKQRCGGALSSWSPTCRLLRVSRARRLEATIAEIRQELTLARRAESRRSFLLQGPPHDLSKVNVVLRESVELWSRSSVLMRQLCEARGIPFFHFLQPNQYVEGSKVIGPREAKVAIGDPQREIYRRPAELGYPLLIEEGKKLAATGEPYFDLTMIFADVTEPLYIDTCCHFGGAGSRRMGAEIARIVLAHEAAR